MPSSPSCGSDSGLNSEADQESTLVSSPGYTIKLEAENEASSTNAMPTMTTSKSWDAYESLEVLDDLFKDENSENKIDISNQVKLEPGDEDNNLMEDIHDLLYGTNNVEAALEAAHDDSSTDLFPDLGDMSSIDPLIATY